MSRLLDWCFKKSIWVYHVNAGSCNGCDIEILDVLTPYYDVERFGIKLVHTPRHADALLVTGPVTRQVRERLLRVYEATPDPKLVIAVGSCATNGGIWYNSYATLGGLSNVLPVNIFIPGCPPRPEAILYGVAQALGLVPKQVESQIVMEA
ncbi:MAG: NADH-quinone oxidoreductase subunit B family protein [Anaerolineales bacterium]|nr:NADH-quinone oxidoreductase subunit B family protein [Anaerolineales bacterium]